MSTLRTTFGKLFGNSRRTHRRALMPSRRRLEQLESRIVFSGVVDVVSASLAEVPEDQGPAEVGVPAALPAVQKVRECVAGAQPLAFHSSDLDAVPVLIENAEVELDSRTIGGAQTLAVLPANEYASDGRDVAFGADGALLERGRSAHEIETHLTTELDGRWNPTEEVEATSSRFVPWLLLLLEGVIGPEPEFEDLEDNPADTQTGCSGGEDDNNSSDSENEETGDTGNGSGDTGDGGGGGGGGGGGDTGDD